jgi:predicted aspartyl protease
MTPRLSRTASSDNRLPATTTQIELRRAGGVLTVPVRINDSFNLNFILDSGAADVSIPADVFLTLIRLGTIQRSDLLGTGSYRMADGSVSSAVRFRIRSLNIGGRKLENVDGSVSNVQGGLLLGQTFLRRFKSWSIDNRRQLLILGE